MVQGKARGKGQVNEAKAKQRVRQGVMARQRAKQGKAQCNRRQGKASGKARCKARQGARQGKGQDSRRGGKAKAMQGNARCNARDEK